MRFACDIPNRTNKSSLPAHGAQSAREKGSKTSTEKPQIKNYSKLVMSDSFLALLEPATSLVNHASGRKRVRAEMQVLEYLSEGRNGREILACMGESIVGYYGPGQLEMMVSRLMQGVLWVSLKGDQEKLAALGEGSLRIDMSSVASASKNKQGQEVVRNMFRDKSVSAQLKKSLPNLTLAHLG